MVLKVACSFIWLLRSAPAIRLSSRGAPKRAPDESGSWLSMSGVLLVTRSGWARPDTVEARVAAILPNTRARYNFSV